MEEALQQLQMKDTKERLAGIERLQMLLEQSRKVLSSSDVANIVEATRNLLNDSSFRVCQGALQALESVAALSGEQLKMHFTTLVPAIVECLGDSKQPVRDAGRRLLLALMEISSPSIVVERAGSYAWGHKNWRVREEFARTAVSCVSLFAATEIPLQRLLLPSILQLLEDNNSNVRDAAFQCLQEMYHRGESQLQDELERHTLQPEYLEAILSKLAKGESKCLPLDGISRQYPLQETRSKSNTTRGSRRSPKAKPSMMEVPAPGGDVEAIEKPVDPIVVYSEKELSREIERIAMTLTPEQDWSVRMAAMQRVEALVVGGASEYSTFPMLLRQLVGPLSLQLGDRRSSIVKQACHVLSSLSRELLSDFEPCVELFIPALLKLVVITVQVIAESADNCIKTMLRNCRVSRSLPRIVDISKNDRNGVLRARCCEYALLVLEHWADSVEIQRSAELFEEMIKSCVADAISEVRTTARSCYQLFAKTWPERSQKLFASFDPVIQRLIIDEDRGFHRRYISPSARERLTNASRKSPSNVKNEDSKHMITNAFVVPPIVAMDRRASLSVGQIAKAEVQESQGLEIVADGNKYPEHLFEPSQQHANVIDDILRGLDNLNKAPGQSRTSISPQDSGVDLPSSRDPPHPASSPLSNVSNLTSSKLMLEQVMGSSDHVTTKHISSDLISNLNPRRQISSGLKKRASLDGIHLNPGISHLSSMGANNMSFMKDRLSQSWSNVEDSVLKDSSKLRDYTSQVGQSFTDNTRYNVPGFQRPLVRVSGSGSHRNNMDDNSPLYGEVTNGYHVSSPLSDVLAEGLTVNHNWSSRVAVFNFIEKLIHNGPKGLLEITQNFDKVIKFFCKFLDDPHHKVAQAALKALSELVPNFRKPCEGCLERILPHIFSRLVDPKETIRQLGVTALDNISKTYSIESLLPALLRSLDEQRSLKAKIAVIEFANTVLAKLAASPECSGGSPLIKLWLAKLIPLASEKHQKLKEISVAGIIGIYSHYDATAVLNFILDLGIDDQNRLRRILKHYTPRIEVDIISHLQSKHQRSCSKSTGDQANNTAWDGGYARRPSSTVARNQSNESYSSESINSENNKKPAINHMEPMTFKGEATDELIQTNSMYLGEQKLGSLLNSKQPKGLTSSEFHESHSYARSRVPIKKLSSLQSNSEDRQEQLIADHCLSENRYDCDLEGKLLHQDTSSNGKMNTHTSQDSNLNIPSLLHQMSKGADDVFKHEKANALHKFMDMSRTNAAGWCQYFNQILTAILETLDDPSEVNKELALSVIHEMLINQKDNMEDSVEVVLERLLHISKDSDIKIKGAADLCLKSVLTLYDPYRCLTVLVPLLCCEDEKTLISCISCLTKIVHHLSQEELLSRLSSFLPALFEAFNNQNADIRKSVVFCLVDIYLLLGKSFEPHLSSLTSTQLKLVTIYANRISQARNGSGNI